MTEQILTESGATLGSTRSYLTGFILSILLTGAAFGVVMLGLLPPATMAPVLVILALGQIVTHLIYFLHLHYTSAQQWNLWAFGFMLLVVLILMSGSIWIMANATHNMMVPGPSM